MPEGIVSSILGRREAAMMKSREAKAVWTRETDIRLVFEEHRETCRDVIAKKRAEVIN